MRVFNWVALIRLIESPIRRFNSFNTSGICDSRTVTSLPF